MQKRRAPVLNSRMGSKRELAGRPSILFLTHQRVLLLVITGALAEVYCGEKPSRFTLVTMGSITWFSLWLLPFGDKPAVLGCNVGIHLALACWNLLPWHSRGLCAESIASVSKLNTGDSELVVFSAGLSCSQRSEPARGTQRKTPSWHSSADRKDWAFSARQRAAWSVGNGEDGASLCNTQIYHLTPLIKLVKTREVNLNC